ncbi:MAG: CoA-transferase [Thermodesulfobacteriota bacterium]
MTLKQQPPCSRLELLAVFISREIQDGETVGVGRNLSLPLAGALLAQFHHGPNIRLVFGHVTTNLHHRPAVDFSETDWRRELQWAESFRPEDQTMISLKHLKDTVFFISGLQVDRFGNSNLIGVGPDRRRPRFRGPGAIGTTTLTSYTGRYYLLLSSHEKRVLVEKCDFISCLGWGNGDPDIRRKLGLPGGGPKYCLTPLGVLDFEEYSKNLRLKYLHPGVTVEQVRANTGFEMPLANPMETTPEPTEEELAILRTRVDPKGFLRGGI